MKSGLTVSVVLALISCATMRFAHAQGDIASIREAPFEIIYDTAVPKEDVQLLANTLQKNYSAILQDLGKVGRDSIQVHVHASLGTYMAETRLTRPWRGAYFVRGVLHVQPIHALVTRGILETTIGYELALTCLDNIGNHGCPRWLKEAYAVYHSGELKGLTPAVGARLASFSDLNQDIERYPSPPQRDDVHYILGETMQYLMKQYGATKIFSLYRAFDGMKTVAAVFSKVLGVEYAEVEKKWVETITSAGSHKK
jgi:hypothetical protein